MSPGDRHPSSARPSRPARPTQRETATGRPTKVDLPKDIVDEIRQVAVGTKSDEALGYLSRAAVLLARSDHGAAMKEAEKAKVLAPRSGAVREVLGLAYYGREMYREALSELQTYRRISGRVDQNHVMADCQRALGKPDRAVPLAEEEMRGRGVPNEARAEAAVVAASALSDMGRYEQALALLRRFAAKKAEVGRDYDLRLWYVMGDVLEKSGRKGEAAEQFRKVVRHDSGAYDAAERLAALS